jgi:taurine--2-oxoglutarate transaminase
MSIQNLQQDAKQSTLFSWIAQAAHNPAVIDRAQGCYLYPREGKPILDFSSQLMNVNIGHGHPKVVEAIKKQAESLCYVNPGMITEARAELGMKLQKVTPVDDAKLFFTLGGAEAVDNAIKLSRAYTGRHKIICLYRSYHGATYGAISASGDPRKLPVDSQQMPNVVHVENPYFYRCPWYSESPEECAQRAFEQMQRVIEFEGPENVAAILMEGESGSSGCIKYPPGYWKMVAEFARSHGILLISDEVMSGFGRTGSWFGIENHGVRPDMITMAKGLTSGYVPLGALAVSGEIASNYDQKALPLGLTYSAHPLAMAAALACLEVYEEEGLIEQAQKRGAYLENAVAELQDKHPSIGDFRNTGLLGCLELVRNRETKEPICPWNAKPDQMKIRNEIASKLSELGMFTFVRWSWLFIAPPLIISEAEIDKGLDIISEALMISDYYYEAS